VTFFDRSAGGLPSVGSEIQWQAPHTKTRSVPRVEDERRLDESSSEPHSGQTSGRSMQALSATAARDMKALRASPAGGSGVGGVR